MGARDLWIRLETIHAVTYFAPEARQAAKDIGLRGFWMGYFGFRAAPLGAVSAGAVEATFANFAPEMVRRSVPDVWSFADPASLLTARSAAAAAALRSADPGVEQVAATVATTLDEMIEGADAIGRPLFSANRHLTVPDDPVERLWQQCTTLREHRGDSHVIALTAHGIDGCEAHHLVIAGEQLDPAVLRDNRGWSDDAWHAAADRLAERGLVTDGQLTDAGRAIRASIESATDDLDAASSTEIDELVEALTPASTAIAESGLIPYPNPMGLPRLSP